MTRLRSYCLVVAGIAVIGPIVLLVLLLADVAGRIQRRHRQAREQRRIDEVFDAIVAQTLLEWEGRL